MRDNHVIPSSRSVGRSSSGGGRLVGDPLVSSSLLLLDVSGPSDDEDIEDVVDADVAEELVRAVA